MELTSGADHPGSIGSGADSPATAVVYDMGVGSTAQLLMAGQFSYSGAASRLAGLPPSGCRRARPGLGRPWSSRLDKSQLGLLGPIFRGVRISDSDQFALGDRRQHSVRRRISGGGVQRHDASAAAPRRSGRTPGADMACFDDCCGAVAPGRRIAGRASIGTRFSRRISDPDGSRRTARA